jgi:hypothetical protein
MSSKPRAPDRPIQTTGIWLFGSLSYQQPGISRRQAERAVRRAREVVTLLQREVFNGPQADNN